MKQLGAGNSQGGSTSRLTRSVQGWANGAAEKTTGTGGLAGCVGSWTGDHLGGKDCGDSQTDEVRSLHGGGSSSLVFAESCFGWLLR